MGDKESGLLSKKVLKCEPHRILAAKFEPIVWQEVKTFLLSSETSKGLQAVAISLQQSSTEASDADRIKRKIQALGLQIETLTERVSRLPKGVNEKPFFDQLVKLQQAKELAEVQWIEENSRTQSDEIISYDDFTKFTASLNALVKKADENPETQGEIIRKFVHKIEVTKNGIKIGFHAGKSHYRKELGIGKEGKLIPLEHSRSRSQPLPKFLKDSDSKK